MKKYLVKDSDEVVNQLIKELERLSISAVNEFGVFRVGLSGGSVLNYLCEAIPRLSSNVELSKWKFYFCDERYVKENDPESTYGCYKTKLLPQTKLEVKQFIGINLEMPLEECGRDYELKIRNEFNLTHSKEIPSFDLLLLGMGPDGHTCSLFPNHALLKEHEKLIATVSDSPKPPPQRVTMTFPLINKAKCCIFAMAGAGKAEMVKRVFKDKEQLPAAMVAPEQGDLICILDEEAGKFLS